MISQGTCHRCGKVFAINSENPDYWDRYCFECKWLTEDSKCEHDDTESDSKPVLTKPFYIEDTSWERTYSFTPSTGQTAASTNRDPEQPDLESGMFLSAIFTVLLPVIAWVVCVATLFATAPLRSSEGRSSLPKPQTASDSLHSIDKKESSDKFKKQPSQYVHIWNKTKQAYHLPFTRWRNLNFVLSIASLGALGSLFEWLSIRLFGKSLVTGVMISLMLTWCLWCLIMLLWLVVYLARTLFGWLFAA